jgi:DHA1 family multidrug resistance protein-like MFS transporter
LLQSKKNFLIAWIGTFMAGLAFSEVMPFLSLFIATLGSFNAKQVSFFTGISFAASYVIVIFISPIWGRIADKHGRKPMLLRTSIGMAIVIALIGLSTNVWQVVILRAFQGLFDGYTPSAIALVSSETGAEKRTLLVSKLSTGYIIGGLLGPLVGGLLGMVLNYRAIFEFTGMILFVVGILSGLFIKEDEAKFQATQKNVKKISFKAVLSFELILLLISTMILQFIESLITPFISLVVGSMILNKQYLTLIAGIVAALPGLSTALFSTAIGKLGSQNGEIKILIKFDCVAVVIYLITGMTHTLILFAVFRFLIGICNSALFPLVQGLISNATEYVSTAFSLGLSAQSAGSMFGSLIGGLILQIFDFNALFWTAAIVLVANLVCLKKLSRKMNT